MYILKDVLERSTILSMKQGSKTRSQMIESVCALLQGGAYHIDLQGDNYVGGLPPPPPDNKGEIYLPDRNEIIVLEGI